jgi:hypothetical protein
VYKITKERLQNLDAFYQKIYEILIERGEVILDDISDAPS